MDSYEWGKKMGEKLAGKIFDGLFGLFTSRMSNDDFCHLCEKGSASEILQALQSGANVNGINKAGWSPLMVAAAANPSAEAVAALLKAGADLLYVDANGCSILHYAVGNANPEVVQLLLDMGLDEDVNMPSLAGDTPLTWGAQIRILPEVIEMFAEAGADLNAKNYHGGTPLVYAINFYGNNNAKEMIPALIKAGANVNDQSNPHRVTPLMLAVCNIKDASLIEAFIKGGADVNLKDDRGATAMNYAVHFKNDAAVRVLQKYGAR